MLRGGELGGISLEIVIGPDVEFPEQAYLNAVRLVELNPEAEFTFVVQESFEQRLVEKLGRLGNVRVIPSHDY